MDKIKSRDNKCEYTSRCHIGIVSPKFCYAVNGLSKEKCYLYQELKKNNDGDTVRKEGRSGTC